MGAAQFAPLTDSWGESVSVFRYESAVLFPKQLAAIDGLPLRNRLIGTGGIDARALIQEAAPQINWAVSRPSRKTDLETSPLWTHFKPLPELAHQFKDYREFLREISEQKDLFAKLEGIFVDTWRSGDDFLVVDDSFHAALGDPEYDGNIEMILSSFCQRGKAEPVRHRTISPGFAVGYLKVHHADAEQFCKEIAAEPRHSTQTFGLTG